MAFLFALFKVFAWIAARLPFRMLYCLSGIISVIIQYIVRYRRSIALENLSRSFPEKSPIEIKRILKQYYRNLADIILEVIKLGAISPEDLKRRFTFTGLEHLEKAFQEGRSVIVAIGHCGNWEWMGTALGLYAEPVKGYAIVKPLSDKYFHNYMQFLRHRLNNDSTIPFQHTYRAMARNKREMVTFNVIASDQTPVKDDINYWTTFLNQQTPFFMGVEKIARSLDFTVVFIDNQRTGRGRYNGVIHLISVDPKNTAEFEITEKYVNLLEKSIRNQPGNWLWTHRRWKHASLAPKNTRHVNA